MEKEKTIKKTRARKRPVKEEKPIEPVILAEPILAEPKENIEEPEEFKEDSTGNEKKGKRYYEAVGRRKSAVARIRLLTIKPFEEDEGKITVNGKFYKEYFPTLALQQIAESALRRLKSLNRFEVIAKVNGGGIKGQAEALRHGLARTLVLFNADFRKKLKKAGYIKRDPRVKERKKYGLKKARRAPQWQKR